jgi:REP element-mobilizing transposase RayT
VHVVLRVERDLGNLRVRDLWRAIRAATFCAAERRDFRLVHVSVQRTHLHLIVEAADRMALARGMQGFGISAAKQLNRAASKRRGVRRKGRVICDRYHARSLKTPKSVRNAVAYVVNNWRHHREDRGYPQRTWRVDPYSSGASFDGWDEKLLRPPPTYEPLATHAPATWLLARGWRRHGAIGTREVPGGAHAAE